MVLIDTHLTEEPLDVESFSYLNDSDYPLVFLGFQLKNLYDQKRLIINKKFKPIDIIHFVPHEPVMPKFFRGIKVIPTKKIINLLKELDNLGELSTLSINKKDYSELLSKYNLTCNNCFAFLEKGIYPIDSECMGEAVDTDLCTEELYSKVLDTNNGGFQSFGYFTIYVLSNKNFKKTTTKNFIFTAVKNFNY